jgi:hypothetical protein
MPFLAQFPKFASVLYNPYELDMRANLEPPRSMCKNHLDLHENPPRAACKTTLGCVQNHLDHCAKTPQAACQSLPASKLPLGICAHGSFFK